MPFGLPEAIATRGAGVLADRVLGRLRGPGVGEPHRLPPARPGQVAAPARRLHAASCTTATRCCPRERQRRFLEADGWVAWPGPALADFLRQFIAHNRMLAGRLRDRGAARHARRHHLPDPDLRRRGRRDRAGAGRARDPPRGAARRDLRDRRCAPGTSGSSSAPRPVATTWPTSPAGCTGWPVTASCRTSIGPADVDPDEPRRIERRQPALTQGLELAAGGGARHRPRGRVSRRRAPCASSARAQPRDARAASAPDAPRPDPGHAPRSRSGCCSTRRRARRPTTSSSCSRTARTRTRPARSASTTSSRACCRSACARASTSAC